jgi:hypothetical protein
LDPHDGVGVQSDRSAVRPRIVEGGGIPGGLRQVTEKKNLRRSQHRIARAASTVDAPRLVVLAIENFFEGSATGVGCHYSVRKFAALRVGSE